MKKTLLIPLLVLLSVTAIVGQQRTQFYAPNGLVHSPKGHLHILVIIVRFANFDPMRGNEVWPDSDRLPEMARGLNNQLLSSSPYEVGKGTGPMNLSEFYYEMSGGKFILTGDIFPVQVPVSFDGITKRNVHSRQTLVNKYAVQWIAKRYPDFDWSRYDNRTNHPRYAYDNGSSAPDSVIDYVLFMHRLPGSGGVGTSGNHAIEGTPFRISGGHTSGRSYSDAPHNWEHFKHELAHNLFSAPHYNGANGTDGDKYYVQRGWGLMSDTFSPFFCASAWERWWLGWFDPKTVTEPGTYLLRDFVTTGDALRVRLPGTDQYLWLENHQKISPWDERQFYTKFEEKGHPVTSKGIYGYVAASAASDRNRASLQIFKPGHCNIFKYINGQGLWDFIPTEQESPTEFFQARVNRRSKPNPIAGINDLQSLRWDYNDDGVIQVGMTHGNVGKKQGESHYIWAEEIDGQPKTTYNLLGDERDAYLPGQELSLSGTQPVLNYPVYKLRAQRFEPFILNGLRLRIQQSEEPGVLAIQVDFDDWEIRENKRWCGNIILPDSANTTFLTIAEKATLTLDLGGTCDRIKPHPETGTFTNPTVFTVEDGRGIRLASGSSLIIDNFSELHFNGKSRLVIEKGAKVIVRGEGKLMMNDDSLLIMKKKGRILVEKDGHLGTIPDSRLDQEPRAKIKQKQ